MTTLEERRKKNFRAKIETDFGCDYYLNITHNGHQWNSISLNLSEMKLVKEVLSKKIKEIESD